MEGEVRDLGSDRYPLLDCGHRGLLSVHPSKDGKTQCTSCSNRERFGLIY